MTDLKVETETKSAAPNLDSDFSKTEETSTEDTAKDDAPATTPDATPQPSEDPPLPDEEPAPQDDGWDFEWSDAHKAYWFTNRFTGVSQWENPRMSYPTAAVATPHAPGTDPAAYSSYSNYSSSAVYATSSPAPISTAVLKGYNPAIHGDYDPNADYAQADDDDEQGGSHAPAISSDDAAAYVAQAHFNRFTGRFQSDDLNPERFNDENKSKNQMRAFFDVDAAANSHDGRSLRAERAQKKLTKKEIKAFNEKRRARKEEKRRAWLKD